MQLDLHLMNSKYLAAESEIKANDHEQLSK